MLQGSGLRAQGSGKRADRLADERFDMSHDISYDASRDVTEAGGSMARPRDDWDFGDFFAGFGGRDWSAHWEGWAGRGKRGRARSSQYAAMKIHYPEPSERKAASRL